MIQQFFLPLSVYLFSSSNLVYHSHKTGSTYIPIYKNFLSVHGRIWTCTLCIISLVWELLSIFLYIYVLSNNLHLNYLILLIQYCNQEALSSLLLQPLSTVNHIYESISINPSSSIPVTSLNYIFSLTSRKENVHL